MSRRTRTKDSKQEDIDNDNANDDNNNIHQWSIISPGSSECYFGLAGEAIPSFSVSDPWSSLDVLPDALFASNAPFILRKFTDHFLNDRPLVVCVPVTLPSESRVRICKSFFEMTKISAICLLSEPVACSFACGQVNMSGSGSSSSSSSHHHSHSSSSDTSSTSGVTVIDLGWSHATTSFVEQGRSTKFVSSSSLGLKRFFQLKQQEQKQSSLSSSQSKQHQEELELPTKSLSEEEFNNSPFKHEIASWYLNSSHLESMCSKMPLRALQHHPIVLVGGGGGCDGLGSGLSKLLKKVVYNKKKKYEADDDDSNSSSSDDDDDEDEEEEDGDENNDDVQKKSKEKNKKKSETNLENIRVSNIFRVPVSASRLFAFRGASLLSSCGVLDEMMVASIIVGSSSSSTSSSSTSQQQQQQYHFTAKQKQSANNTLGCVISREEWISAVEKIRAKSLWNQSVSSDQMMIEFLSWRFPK